MKNIFTILAAGILVLFLSNPVSAEDYFGETDSAGGKDAMAEAIKHAE